MKPMLLAIPVMLWSVSAIAECYSRTAMLSQLKAPISRIADVQNHIAPMEHNQFRCRVTFRALIGQDWHTAEGQSVGFAGDNQKQICAQALNIGKSFLLQKIGTGTVNMDSEMICTDQPIPQVRAVQIGQVIRESEVRPHPERIRPFRYQGTQCRWFMETDASGRDLVQWQGIMCHVGNDQWKVLDKF